jgi:hypothetical protein
MSVHPRPRTVRRHLVRAINPIWVVPEVMFLILSKFHIHMDRQNIPEAASFGGPNLHFWLVTVPLSIGVVFRCVSSACQRSTSKLSIDDINLSLSVL